MGSELSFLKMVSVLVGLSGSVLNFSSKPVQPKLLFFQKKVHRAVQIKVSHRKGVGYVMCACVNIIIIVYVY